MENPNLHRGQLFHALKCPFCPNVFVESLWSLVSHLNISHGSQQDKFKFTFTNLERQKTLVSKQQVCIIRPAFDETNEPTDFLRMLIAYSGGGSTSGFNLQTVETPEAVEVLETFATGRKATRTCMECGEIVARKHFLDHCSKHVTQLNKPHEDTSSSDTSSSVGPEANISPSITPAASTSSFAPGMEADVTTSSSLQLAGSQPPMATMPANSPSSAAEPNDISILCDPSRASSLPPMDAKDNTSKKKLQGGGGGMPGRKMTISKILSLMCPQCGMSFENRCKLTRHLIDHKMAQNPYRCPIPNCLQSYDSRSKFRSHLARCHRSLQADRIEELLLQGDQEVVRIRSGQKPAIPRTRGLSFMESLQLNQALGAQSPLLSVPVEASGSDGFMVPPETLSQLLPNSKYAAVHNGARVGIVMTHGRFASVKDSPGAAIQAQIILDNEGSVDGDASQGSQAAASDAEQQQEPSPSKRKARSLDETVDLLKREFIEDDIAEDGVAKAEPTSDFACPQSNNRIRDICELTRREVDIYARAGVDGIVLENMHDIPYITAEKTGPEIVSAMTRACVEAVHVLGSDRNRFLMGVQVLAGANKEALAVAQSAGLDFVRAECFVFSHVADEGLMHACAGELLRYRKQIGADDVAVLADIKKKHCSHSITADIGMRDLAHAAEFFLADGVIVTGNATGQEASPAEIKDVKTAAPNLPILVGSGVTKANFRQFSAADAFIVGSHFKVGGQWQNALDEKRVKSFMHEVRTFKRRQNDVDSTLRD
ncbi:hypothetical protein AAVH_04721 [Aphelenchoides avenae]|nr:hypothetical protein AAVH_04721 [Aphelenchus avenae]